MDHSKIPQELRELDQWVCNWEGSKVPMRAFERAGASSTDPSTWASFEAACQAVDAGIYDYLGFVFADNGIVGIDIDTGFEDGLMTPLCVDIISACESYTEISKSGRGVHIFVKGVLPFPGKNNQAGVEIYQSKRYFVTTGKQTLFTEIIENQAGIDYVLGKYFPETSPVKSEGGSVKSYSRDSKIYRPGFKKPQKGSLTLNPKHEEISKGNRHLCLLSIAGTLWKQGYTVKDLYQELSRVNAEVCKPPLPAKEIESICKSIRKYER